MCHYSIVFTFLFAIPEPEDFAHRRDCIEVITQIYSIYREKISRICKKTPSDGKIAQRRVNRQVKQATAGDTPKVPDYSRKVLRFLPIPPYFFGILLHFRFAPASLPLAVLHRERDNAAVHHIWVFLRHEIPKKEKKCPSCMPKMAQHIP